MIVLVAVNVGVIVRVLVLVKVAVAALTVVRLSKKKEIRKIGKYRNFFMMPPNVFVKTPLIL